MTHDRISGRQLNLWLASMMLVPAIMCAGKYSLLDFGIITTVSAVMLFAVYRFGTEVNAVFLRWLQIAWLVVILSLFSEKASDIWPSGNDFPIVPLVLLAIASVSALSDVEGTAQVNTIVFWFAGVLAACVLAAGVKEVSLPNLSWELEARGIDVLWMFILPALALCLPQQQERGKLIPVFLPFSVLVFSVWAEGILSTALCRNETWPVYEASKSIRINAAADRLEPLVSVCTTIAYYSLYSFVLTVIVRLTGHRSNQKIGVILLLVITAALCMAQWLRISSAWASIVSVLLWVVMPVSCGIISAQKKCRKNEKKA